MRDHITAKERLSGLDGSKRDIDKENQNISIRRDLNLYDTESVEDRRCQDCGRLGHCEC